MAPGPRRARRRPEPGQIFKTTIVLQDILNSFARWLANEQGIAFTLPQSEYVPPDGEGNRPCIVLESAPEGLLALPLATFHGTSPEGWNLFLREIAVPIGLTIPPMFEDRKAFDTDPTWTHPLNYASYVVPTTILVPHTARLTRYPVAMDLANLRALQTHCEEIQDELRFSPIEHARALLKSYKEQPTDRYRAPHMAVTHNTGLNPLASPFTPSAVLSFPRDDGSLVSGCSVWNGASRSQAASILEVLQGGPQAPSHV